MRLINCVGGYGDILFCEPIFKHFLQKDNIKPRVIIQDHQIWISQYIKSADFIMKSTVFVEPIDTMYHSDQFINLRYANQILREYGPDDHHDLENMMLDKYRLLGLPEDLWKTLDVILPAEKGSELTKKVGIIPEAVLLNENCQIGKCNVLPQGLQAYKVWMSEYPGFKLIDWWHSIRWARENHHVSTSTFFLMQAIKNKFPEWNAPCYIYPRPNVDGLRGISQLKPDFNLIKIEK